MAKTLTYTVIITIFRYPTQTVAPQSSDVTPRRPEKHIAKTHMDVIIPISQYPHKQHKANKDIHMAKTHMDVTITIIFAKLHTS